MSAGPPGRLKIFIISRLTKCESNESCMYESRSTAAVYSKLIDTQVRSNSVKKR